MKLKRTAKGPSIGNRIFLTFIIFLIFTGLSLWLVDKGITPAIQDIAETKTRQFARDAINEAVSKQIAEDMQFDNLVRIEKDNEGNIVYMGWNNAAVNKSLRNTTYRVQTFLRKMELNELPMEDTNLEADIETDSSDEDSGVKPATLIEVPLGLATNNTVLANLGPSIPVQLRVIGDVQTQFRNEITEYGINAAHFQLWINFKVSLQVVIPFAMETITVTNDVPLDSGTIMGDVPEFYNGEGESKSPTLSLPMDHLQ